jgi:hypothetical protein
MRNYQIKQIGDLITVKIFNPMIDRRTRALSQTLQQSIAASGGKIRLLLSIETQLPAGSPESLFENLHFVKLNADRIERMAVVGSKSWERTCVALFGLFGRVEVEYFDRSEAAAAVKWLLGKRVDKKKSIEGPGPG